MMLTTQILAAAVTVAAAADRPLSVCVTVPDLGSLCRSVGGDDVEVTEFVKGAQDPHFLEAKPSFIKSLSKADLFVHVGLDLEIGWAPVLWGSARNAAVLPGAAGYLDASSAIIPLDLPAGIVDRSMGDVHPLGNPHYLVDPLSGLRVARAIRDRLSDLRPSARERFTARYGDLARAVVARLVGEAVAAKYGQGKVETLEKLGTLIERGKLEEFLRAQGDEALLGGWVGRLRATRGVPLVADHKIWPYFAGRFGLEVIGYLEPKPGVAPSTRHLADLVELMKARGARGLLSVRYFDPRHAAFVAERTGAAVIEMAHQCGSRPGTDDYLSMVEYNVGSIEKAVGGAR